MTKNLHRLLDEANEEDEREQRKVGEKRNRALDQALETALWTDGRLNTVGVTPTATPFDANTAVTMVDIGGNPVTISFNHMFQKMRDLEAKVEILLERTSSNIPNVGCAGGKTLWASNRPPKTLLRCTWWPKKLYKEKFSEAL